MSIAERILEESFDIDLEGHNGKCKVLYSEMAEGIIKDILTEVKEKISNTKYELNTNEVQRIKIIIDSYLN